MTMTPFYGAADPVEGEATVRHALDVGIDFLDTSDAYAKGENEKLIGRAIKGIRNRYVIATKFGNLRLPDGTPKVDGSPAYVPKACEASLARLGVDHIDLYYLHRFDPVVPIEDTVGAMARLVLQGKIRHIGLSEVSAATLRKASAAAPITALQSEYSLFTRDLEADVLPVCRELGIGYVAYAPLGRGLLTGAVDRKALDPTDVRLTMPRFNDDANAAHNDRLVARLRELAEVERCTPAQLAIAWVLSRGDDIVPIAGTSKRKRLDENAQAAKLVLRDETLRELDVVFQRGAVKGARTSEVLLKRLGR
jgi:aryl-alcohol dehydrogenase-like predicted oxidoreductase